MLVNDILSVYGGHIIITKNGKTLYNSEKSSDIPPDIMTQLIWHIETKDNVLILEV